VLEVLQPSDGGIPRHVADLALGLTARGTAVTVAGPPDLNVRERLEGGGAAVRELPIAPELLAVTGDWSSLRRLAALLREGAFDLLHAHGQKAGVLARLAARRAGVPALYTPHSLIYRTQLLRPRPSARARFVLSRQLERALGRGTAAIVAVAEEERAAVIEDGLAPPERVHAIVNGVACEVDAAPHPQLTAFRGDGPLLGFVAGLRPQKGLPTLLEALELLAARGAAPRFAIVGNGPMRAEVEERVRGGPLAASTLVAPFAASSESYLAALDVYVLPSYWEGLPIAALEAMAMGVPVLATAVNGTPEAVLDGETGLLVPSHDPVALADRMAELAADAELRRRLGQRGRQVVAERFTVEAMVDRTLALYGEVVSAGSGGP